MSLSAQLIKLLNKEFIEDAKSGLELGWKKAPPKTRGTDISIGITLTPVNASGPENENIPISNP